MLMLLICNMSPLSWSMSILILLWKQDGSHKCVGNAHTILLDVELGKNMSRATWATRHLGKFIQRGSIGSIFCFYERIILSQSESEISEVIGGLSFTLRELLKMILFVRRGGGERVSYMLFSYFSKLLSIQRGMNISNVLQKKMVENTLSFLTSRLVV